ncbi:MAG: sigma-70 family RNA polymerase sigma factor [Sporocytophaga sp.]|jgi:RNA polymerase sigma factor (sigma-70 family)|uniref:RNA polymerase subunit sigma-24 n=1 Tax=Sporocytophaga myxococcoides TaxID=153721 RepID=A0A098LBV6_9BACT|nr:MULTISPECIES: sigma-70 family RNA polymerase sigma factor [Sporocytophaga]MBO9698588.1 sigma-70 family RNA polymerase sigma factor [Sporocytophaga sp.]MCR6641958.1 sigma-70 family RNA polymerase sigma factor [Sporocytophaga sp.]GAL84420.1 RNA polymerase subunit sigma-24 [Sporocytophaga myxococcoides]
MKNAAIISDAKLVSLYISGDENSFAQLLKRHKAKVYTTIYLIVKDQYIAEDLLQETFIKAIKKLKSGDYNEEGKFLPWIVRIAHNLAIDYFRREKRYPTIIMEDGSNIFNSLDFSEDSTESLQIKDETHAILRKLIQTLPEPQREVLLMRHYGEMSFQEIADATGVSINTALGRMRYALINLRKKLEKQNVAYDKNFYPE